MAKTDYTKVEGSFDDGLRKLSVGKLLGMADMMDAAKSPDAAKLAKLPNQELIVKRQMLVALKHELKHLNKHMQNVYESLKIDKKELKGFIDMPQSLTAQDWEKYKKLKSEVDKIKSESDSKTPIEDLVEKERVKHKNKRFNVNDKWLPLK